MLETVYLTVKGSRRESKSRQNEEEKNEERRIIDSLKWSSSFAHLHGKEREREWMDNEAREGHTKNRVKGRERLQLSGNWNKSLANCWIIQLNGFQLQLPPSFFFFSSSSSHFQGKQNGLNAVTKRGPREERERRERVDDEVVRYQNQNSKGEEGMFDL